MIGHTAVVHQNVSGVRAFHPHYSCICEVNLVWHGSMSLMLQDLRPRPVGLLKMDDGDLDSL